jgi:hypothetical protein
MGPLYLVSSKRNVGWRVREMGCFQEDLALVPAERRFGAWICRNKRKKNYVK